MLASIGRGHYDAAYDAGTTHSLKSRFNNVKSVVGVRTLMLRLQIAIDLDQLPSIVPLLMFLVFKLEKHKKCLNLFIRNIISNIA